MTIRAMNLSSRTLGVITALGLAGMSLAGCVYYPSGYAYGGPGYAPGYVAAPPVNVVVAGGWWGGWWGHGGGWRR